MKLSTVALLLVTVVGTVSFNLTSATAGELNMRSTNQRNNNISIGGDKGQVNNPQHNKERRIAELRANQLRAREQQLIAEKRLREQQQRIVEQGFRELRSHS